MPAYDLIYNLVKTALVKDGWTITHDPLKLVIDELKGYVDLGAEKAIAAIKGNRKIAVEIKGFQGPSKMQALEGAIGQYQLYAAMLEELDQTASSIWPLLSQHLSTCLIPKPVASCYKGWVYAL